MSARLDIRDEIESHLPGEALKPYRDTLREFDSYSGMDSKERENLSETFKGIVLYSLRLGNKNQPLNGERINSEDFIKGLKDATKNMPNQESDLESRGGVEWTIAAISAGGLAHEVKHTKLETKIHRSYSENQSRVYALQERAVLQI